jgi:hypothetical protein
MQIHKTLLAKLLFVIVPIFLALSILATWFLSLQDLRIERDALAARIGNLAARTPTQAPIPSSLMPRRDCTPPSPEAPYLR